MSGQVRILLRCTTSKFNEYLLLSVAFDRWYDIKIIYPFCKKIGWWDFCFAQKFCKFCKFWRKYFNGNISGHVCIQPKRKYDIKVLFEIYRMILVWTPNSCVRCVQVRYLANYLIFKNCTKFKKITVKKFIFQNFDTGLILIGVLRVYSWSFIAKHLFRLLFFLDL